MDAPPVRLEGSIENILVPTGAATCHACFVTDYSLGDVARILKVSPGRLRYWQRTELVESLASASDDDGYAFRDLVVLRAIVSLLDKGIPLQRIRRNLEAVRSRLPELDEPAAALRVWDDASPRLVLRNEGRLEETGGQLLLDFQDGDPGGADGRAALVEFDAGGTSPGSFHEDRSSRSRADEAVAWFERGCELDADPGQWARAIEAYEMALELEDDYADAYCNLGAVRYNQGKHADARRAFEACLAREADHVEANFNLANVLEEEGDDGGALTHYRRALTADPHYPDLHINLALLYEKIGRPRPAIEHWRRLLQLDPQGSWAEVARARLEETPNRSRSRPE